MKKLFSLCAVFILFLLAPSCRKDPLALSLKGTAWVASGLEYDRIALYTLSFEEETFSLTTMALTDNVVKTVTMKGIYTYENPFVTLLLDLDKESIPLQGLRKGLEITFSVKDESLVFTKH